MDKGKIVVDFDKYHFKEDDFFWYREDIFSMIYGTKDKEQMTTKVNGTFLNGFAILDNPVDYVSVIKLDGRSYRNTNNGDRFEFELKTIKSAVPEIVSNTLIESDNQKHYVSVVLNGSLITNYSDTKNSHVPEMTVVKFITKYFKHDSFDPARVEYLEKAKESGTVVIKEFDNYLDAANAIYELSIDNDAKEPDLHLFSIQDNYSGVNIIDDSNQVQNGEFVGNFYLQPDIVPLLNAFQSVMDNKERISFLFTGESGYGKTSAFKAIADKMTVPCLYQDCSVMLNTTDWFGHMKAENGNTLFEETDFTRFLEKGNCVIILDEFNRLPIEAANSLLPILDDRGETTVKNRHIKRVGGILFGITLNEGIEYTGIGGMLDKAIMSRIYGKLEIKPLPAHIELEVLKRNYNVPEEMLKNLVRLMNVSRDTLNRQRKEGNYLQADVSTRTSKMIAWWLQSGLDMKSAFDYALFNFLNEAEKSIFVDTINITGLL